MLGDFIACPQGASCQRQAQQPHHDEPAGGAESAGIMQRLDELMRRCREDSHRPTYQDLLEVRTGGRRG